MAKKHKFSYAICNQFAPDIFKKQCVAIEKNIPDLEKDELLKDVDGSTYQRYIHKKGEIIVDNNYYMNELNVESDFDLTPYFT